MKISNKKELFSHIYIAPTQDLTAPKLNVVRGVCGTIGKLPLGNPHYLQSVYGAFKPKTTLPSLGGVKENAIGTHIADFFGINPNGMLLVGRALGATSTTKVLAIASGKTNLKLTSTEVNVYGSDNITTWSDSAIDSKNDIELLLTCLPSEKTQISMKLSNGYLTIDLFNEFGNKFYSVTGHTDIAHKDDNGNDDFIGLSINNKMLEVKISDTAPTTDFTTSLTCQSGELLAEVGALNYTLAITKLTNKIDNIDYVFTSNIADIQVIKSLYAIVDKAGGELIVDVVGDTIAKATAFNNALALNKSEVYKIWHRYKDRFSYGVQNIGLSGFIAGARVNRNLKTPFDIAENRAEYAIAGVDFPLPRVVANEVDKFTDDELTQLAKLRINATGFINDTYCIMDCLTGNIKEQPSKLETIIGTAIHIERVGAKMIKSVAFKNMIQSISRLELQLDTFFKNLKQLNTFDNGDYSFEVSKLDSETIQIAYDFTSAGLVRNGKIIGKIKG